MKDEESMIVDERAGYQPREELTIRRFAEIILARIWTCYSDLREGATPRSFENEILYPILALDDSRIEDPIEIVRQFVSSLDAAKDNGWIASSPLSPLVISCVYCMRAMRSRDQGMKEIAWSYMTSASYWCGVSVADKGIEKERVETVKKSKALVPATGGKGKGAKSEPVKSFARSKISERSNWTSYRHAAQAYEKEIYEFSIGKAKFKEEAFQDTLVDWIAQMAKEDKEFAARFRSRGGSAPKSNRSNKLRVC